MKLTPDLFVFTDIEASALGAGSFPIEIGWAGVDLVPHHFLIKPHQTWTKEFWNPESEKVHNISWEQLMEEGINPKEAAERVIDAFRQKLIISDNPSYEAKWFLRLFEAVDIKADFVFRNHFDEVMTYIRDLYEAWGEAANIEGTGRWENVQKIIGVTEAVMRTFPHTHRASDDAVQLAATFKILVDPEWDYKAARERFLPIGKVSK